MVYRYLMNSQARSFQEMLQSRYRREFRFLFSALAFMGAACTSIAATFVDIDGTFTRDPNVEFSALSVPGDGNCFFWSLLVGLEIHKALHNNGGRFSAKVRKTVSHDDVLEVREQFKNIGRALVNWYRKNVKCLCYVRLTADEQQAIGRLFLARGIENDVEKQKVEIEFFLRELSSHYNRRSTIERMRARNEHLRKIGEVLGSCCTEFLEKLYPAEYWVDNVNVDTIQWYHVNAIFGDGIWFPGMLANLCMGLGVLWEDPNTPAPNVIVMQKGKSEGVDQWCLLGELFPYRSVIPIQFIGDNHYEPLVPVQSGATTGARDQDGSSWKRDARPVLPGARGTILGASRRFL